MSYREKTNRSLKKVLLMRGCCKSEVLPKEVLLYDFKTSDCNDGHCYRIGRRSAIVH